MAKNKLSALLSAIDDALENADNAQALQLILANWPSLSDPAPLRERIASILASLGRKREAVDVYDLVARHYANSGYPMHCLAAVKHMQMLQPNSTVLLDHFAALYNIRSPYLQSDRLVEDFAEPESDLILTVDVSPEDEEMLLELAVEHALDDKKVVSKPGTLPPLPLLSLLPSEALRRVLDFLDYDIFPQAQPVIEDGKKITDLLWTVSSDVVVGEDKKGLRLPSGTLLGLSGFGQSATMAEFTAMSRKGSEMMRLSHKAITALSEEYGDFQNRLATLRRHALTEGLLQRHILFSELSEDDRLDLCSQFTGLRIAQGEYLIYQGSPSPGLFIILDGQVDINRNDEDWEITIATLTAGKVFGEVGLVSDSPAIANVVMTIPGHVLFLSREDFSHVAARHPSLARYAVKLATERIQDVEETLSAHDLAEME